MKFVLQEEKGSFNQIITRWSTIENRFC